MPRGLRPWMTSMAPARPSGCRRQRSQVRIFNRISSQFEDSKAEAQSDRGIDVVALEKAVGQSAIHLREHEPEIEIPLWCKPPIDSGRDRVKRPGALRVLGSVAGGRPPGC